MPWVYTLKLTEFRESDGVKHDWEENIPGQAAVRDDLGGVTVSGRQAVIVSERNNPDYNRMEDHSYVRSIEERREIPSRDGENFEPPIRLGWGIVLVE